ncbi:MAG: tetratricopeptide repeat protein [Nitrospinota bacterium]
MSIYKRKIKAKKEVSNIDSSSFINALKDNIQAVTISAAVIVIVVGGFYYGRHNDNKKNLKLSDRLYKDFNDKSNIDLDQVKGYIADYKGNTADIGRLSLAKAYYEAGRYEDALLVYKELSKMTSEAQFKVSAYLGIGYSSQRLGNYEEAVEAFKLAFDNAGEAISLDLYKVEARIALGLSYEILGDKKEALSQYDWVMDNFPNSQLVSPFLEQKAAFLERAL